MAYGFRVVLIGAIVTYVIGAVAIRSFAAQGAMVDSAEGGAGEMTATSHAGEP
jgi:hypothetical protein